MSPIMVAYQLFLVLFLSVAENSAVAGRLLKGSILPGFDALTSTSVSNVKSPSRHSGNPTIQLSNLPRNVFEFSQDKLEHQKQMADIQGVVKYLEDENAAGAENVESHFVVDTSGKVSNVIVDAHGQSDDTKKLPQLQQNKEVLRRPSSWGRKLGPYNPLEGDNRQTGSGLPGVDRASEQQRAQFEERVGGDSNQLPMNGNLTTILLFCAVILSVSLATVLPVNLTVASRRHLGQKVKIPSVNYHGDYSGPLMPKSPTKFSTWLVRGRKPRKVKVEELQGDNLV